MSARLRVALIALYAMTVLFSLSFPTAARAQTASDSAAAAPGLSDTEHRGPTMNSLAVGAHRLDSSLPAASEQAAQRRGAGLAQSEAMMIVGGAAILVGAIVGGDPGRIIMIGGAVVGLVGLYKYLQ